MNKTFQLLTNVIIGILAFFIILFTCMGIFETIDGMRIYTVSEDSLLFALEDGRYGDLVTHYHNNQAAESKTTQTMEECYAIARYYESALDYKLALQEQDETLQNELQLKMNDAADGMGELSYAKEEIDALLGI